MLSPSRKPDACTPEMIRLPHSLWARADNTFSFGGARLASVNETGAQVQEDRLLNQPMPKP